MLIVLPVALLMLTADPDLNHPGGQTGISGVMVNRRTWKCVRLVDHAVFQNPARIQFRFPKLE